MKNLLVEFSVIIVLFSVLGSSAIALLPVISFWTVFPICALAILLHLGHGYLLMVHMRPLIAGHEKKSKMESGLMTLIETSGAVTVILLLMFTTAKVLTA